MDICDEHCHFDVPFISCIAQQVQTTTALKIVLVRVFHEELVRLHTAAAAAAAALFGPAVWIF